MKTIYEPKLKAHVSTDDRGKVCHIRHNQEFWETGENVPHTSGETYLGKWAEALQIPREQLQNLNRNVSFLDPREQGVEYQKYEEKHMFDSTTLGYYQTFLNVPVWRRGLTIKIKQNPHRVVGSTVNSEDDIEGKLPTKKSIEAYKRLFAEIAARKAKGNTAGTPDTGGPDDPADLIRKILETAFPRRAASQKRPPAVELESGKFFIYKYRPEKRFGGKPLPSDPRSKNFSPEDQATPIPELPPVDAKIKAGRSYLVAEIVFTANLGGLGPLSWLILVEVETNSVLYIECMAAGVNGLVFRRDPMVKTGDQTITADDSTAALNMQRDDVLLTNLGAPVVNVQSLTGTYVTISEQESPSVAAPTMPTAMDFDFPSRSNNFGAVSAYYHQTELFKTIEGLGFPIATYLDGTTFPIPVDHRGMGSLGGTINAHCIGNTTGTTHMCFALCDLTNTTDPLCRAVDPWVHWHEMGGHGLLYDHVGSANLGFSHSAGDSLAALQMDPESGLRGVAERFRYAPFRPIQFTDGISSERRFDRGLAAWAWGSQVLTGPAPNFVLISGDDGGYGSEQILATCHFRIYRSIGGDSADVSRRIFASRMMSYLILRTIGNLTTMTNPSDPQIWCEEMQDVDLENWTSEGLSGGAYNKVVRWSFEQQGCYQPVGAPTPVITAGDPPTVDVYIDDGRHGEYQYQPVHWENQSMWNRNTADNLPGHQPAIDGQPNFMYVEVKNRGTAAASSNVKVRAYHSKPGAGLTWPTDFVEMSPIGGITAGSSVPAGSASAVKVGPFEWEPNINAFGHDCVLMIASAPGDPSNVDNFTGTETIQEWRLVPNDNNVGQRNVQFASGESGESLLKSLDGVFFIAGNNLNKVATMELKVDMPKVLKSKRWKLNFEVPKKFRLKPGEKRRVQLLLEKGEDFKKAEIRDSRDRTIRVNLFADGILLGGMSYELDPDFKPPRRKP